jgi:hypothetical protein
MYHTIIVTSETRARRLVNSLHPRPVFASANIKSMCLRGTVQLTTAAEVMQLCSGIDHLALWILLDWERYSVTLVPPHFLLDALNRLTLSRLSIHLSTIFCGVTVPVLPSIPFFSKITHLELMECWVLWRSPITIGIHCLTQLTHISLRVSTNHTAPSLLQIILVDCNLLQVLALHVTEEVEKVEKWLLEHNGLDDPRIVVTTKKHIASNGIGVWQYS